MPQAIGAALGAAVGGAAAYNQGARGWSLAFAVGGGALSGALSTIGIYGANPILAGAAIGGLTNFASNVLGQAILGGSSALPGAPDFDARSAAIAGLAGLAGGTIGGGLLSQFPTEEAFAAAFSAASTLYLETSATQPIPCPQ